MSQLVTSLEIEQYKIYKRNGYYLCMSDIESNNYQLFIGFANKDLNSLSKEEIIAEIRRISDLINMINKSGLFVLPIINPYELEQAAMENDDRLFYEIMSKKIQPITNDIYTLLRSENKKIDSVIRMIKQTDADRKLIDWMDMKLMESGVDYIEDIEYEKLKVQNKQEPNKVQQEVYTQNPQENNSYAIPPIDRSYEETMSQTKSNQLARRLVKPNEHRRPSGFSNFGFIMIVLSISILLGIGFGYLVIK